MEMFDIVGKWFKAGDAYQGCVVEELANMFFKVQLYHEPRHVKRQVITVPATNMLQWDFFRNEREYRHACRNKFDELPTPVDIDWETR
jgi:hypothetical protein